MMMLLVAACAFGAGMAVGGGVAEEPPALVLEPVAKLGPGARKEISGIVRGRREADLYWTINDSGDEPRLYPIRGDGTTIAAVRYEEPGVLVGGAINSDWEDIAIDGSGRLIAADFGNNSNARADLTLYLIEEPEPTVGKTTYTTKIMFRYADQPSRPAPRDRFNFDAEALFAVGDDLFVLTKHRSDTLTTMYRVFPREAGVVNVLEPLARFDVLGRATGADASGDGLRLAVLTYQRIWVFERESLAQGFFEGRAWSRQYRMEDGESDSEAICFDENGDLVIADEARATLYRVPIGAVIGGGTLSPGLAATGP